MAPLSHQRFSVGEASLVMAERILRSCGLKPYGSAEKIGPGRRYLWHVWKGDEAQTRITTFNRKTQKWEIERSGT